MTRFYPLFLSAGLAPTSTHVFAAVGAPSADLGAGVLQLLSVLAIMLAALIGGMWLLKKLTMQRGEAAGLLRLVAGAAVGPRERVVIVEAGGVWLVLGVAPGRVSALAEIPRQSISPAPNVTASTPTPTPNFADWLRKIKQKPQGEAS
ncbi:MAG TPA: flagellar biosynthetic protein FliO [Rhodocyclaceae bacterium]|nr:flagellar biosynthetic protein FliO [Rhodocyclaceae bacterium]